MSELRFYKNLEKERRKPLNRAGALFGRGRRYSFGVKRGRCSFGVKRTKNAGVSIPPRPLNDLAGAKIAACVH